MGRTLRVGVAVAVVLALAVGCSQARKADLAKRVDRAVPRDGAATLSGRMTLRLLPRNLPGGPGGPGGGAAGPIPQGVSIPGAGGIPGGAGFPPGAGLGSTITSVAFVAVPGERRVAILEPKGDGTAVLISDRTIYVRRQTRSKADRRPWVRLELSRLDEIEAPELQPLLEGISAGDVVIANPIVMLEILAGVLTGSVKSDDASGAGQRVRFNASFDKANRELDLDDNRREERATVLQALAVTSDIHRGQAVVRSDGSLASVEITLTAKPDKVSRVDLTAELSFEPLSAPPEAIVLAPPAAETTIRVATLADVRGAARDRLAPQAQASATATLVPVPVAGG